ncbi:MAG: peptidoglycan-associated lipoprotein Pal [Syntrophales bacterium]|jgi:OOP family OmpA-OmpF porin|nr:peptidoglycan-associated lipoprotein Pal [Syntrophales bacterium]
MKSSGLRVLLVVFVCLLFAGCATQKAAFSPDSLDGRLKSGQLIQKANNFDVLFDKSSSMDDPYGKTTELALARDVTERMITTIPDIKLTAGLRDFYNDKSHLLYGMTAFDKTAFIAGMKTLQWGSGPTPMEKAIDGAAIDLQGKAGNSAVIIVSDFENIPGVDDLQPAKVIPAVARLKAQYGDRVCIYTIQIGKFPRANLVIDAIRQEAKCGFDVNADDLATQAAMDAFVEKVFLTTPPPPQAAAAPVVQQVQEAKAEAAAPAVALELANIHFDFDKSAIRTPDREILKGHADWLTKNKDYSLTVEGYCDERGSTEYNLALGERRAMEAKKYLVGLGVDEKRLKAISYGFERPLDPGHNEAAWAKNRRAQFVPVQNK